ncbi:DUF3179 domain-containing protein [Halobaculum sp. EA56]|uniref:DUF3179 domain-containing protein n=1 Tax=Halobaculum sp. EA56 TaxID=3421648 RepID=UPI003EBB271B
MSDEATRDADVPAPEPDEVRQVVPRDAIPAVDDPAFVPPGEYDGDADDEVVAVAVDGDARAYPVRYLHYHEVVNDEVGGRPVAVTWCPLCGSAVVYDRRVADRTLSFGVSGKLADDDLVLYDRETDSEWKQSAGVGIDGDLAGERLDPVAAPLFPLSRFRERHPDGVVLAPPGGESEAAGDGDDPATIDYEEDPYEGYVAAEGFGLAAHRGDGTERRGWPVDRLDPKAVVCGLELDGDAVGVPRPVVAEAGGVVTLRVGGVDAVVLAADEAGIHAFRDPGFDWDPAADGVRGGGVLWDPATGEAVDRSDAGDDAEVGADGSPPGGTLDRLPARRLFAFAWVDDHGVESLYRG